MLGWDEQMDRETGRWSIEQMAKRRDRSMGCMHIKRCIGRRCMPYAICHRGIEALLYGIRHTLGIKTCIKCKLSVHKVTHV
jgi:hypothetical protein